MDGCKEGNCQERKEIQGFMVVAQVALNACIPIDVHTPYIGSLRYR